MAKLAGFKRNQNKWPLLAAVGAALVAGVYVYLSHADTVTKGAKVTIKTPQSLELRAGQIQVAGDAAAVVKGDTLVSPLRFQYASIAKVEVAWDDGTFVTASVTNPSTTDALGGSSANWSITLDSRQVVDGRHNIVARATTTLGDTASTQVGIVIHNAPIVCTTDDWPTANHDNHRTSSSAGCAFGRMQQVWSYTPPNVGNSIAPTVWADNSLYLRYAGQPCANTTCPGWNGWDVFTTRMTPTGSVMWSFKARANAGGGEWPSVGNGTYGYCDDFCYAINTATGASLFNLGSPNSLADDWGETLNDGSLLYTMNAWKEEKNTAWLFLDAYTKLGQRVWIAEQHDIANQNHFGNFAPGIAADQGTTFFTGAYKKPISQNGSDVLVPLPGAASGLFAFTSATGALKWSSPATPASAVSVDGQKAYLLEENTGIVARRESDGSLVWSTPITNIADYAAQAPVLTGSLVIVGGASGVSAFNATTGALVWRNTDSGLKLYSPETATSHSTSSLLAAQGSQTLIGVDGTQVCVIALGDGSSLGCTAVAGDAPILVGKRLYLRSGKSLIGLEPDITTN